MTSAQRWMCCAVVLSMLVVGTWVSAFVTGGCNTFGLVLVGISLLVSMGAIGTAGMAFLAAMCRALPVWLGAGRDGPRRDQARW